VRQFIFRIVLYGRRAVRPVPCESVAAINRIVIARSAMLSVASAADTETETPLFAVKECRVSYHTRCRRVQCKQPISRWVTNWRYHSVTRGVRYISPIIRSTAARSRIDRWSCVLAAGNCRRRASGIIIFLPRNFLASLNTELDSFFSCVFKYDSVDWNSYTPLSHVGAYCLRN